VDFMEIRWDGMGCIYLAQDLDMALIPFDTIIYFVFNKMRAIFLIGGRTTVFSRTLQYGIQIYEKKSYG